MDGIRWTKNPQPVLTSGSSDWDSGVRGQVAGIGCATSTDGTNWTKDPGNPVLTTNPDMEWESYVITDGRTWSRYAGNPVMRLGPPGSWEDFSLSQNTTIYRDGTLITWYGARDLSGTGQYKIGFASSQGPLDVAPVKPLPQEFTLYPSDPNPFNPRTIIQYEVPRASQISIIIYNTLGQQLVTLVDEIKQPGRFTTSWNAEGVASGSPWYRMSVDGMVFTQRLLHVK